jgi:uncharacterized membrane protein YcaP (DUF421 family)
MEAYLETIGKAIILFIAGIFLLRIAGRKSISQMTLAQTVIMISVGSIIIQPITDSNIWRTITATAVLVVLLILAEYLQVKFNFLEKFITGKAKVVIKNGEPEIDTLRKLRLSVDQLEIRLRQQGIEKMSDVKTATLEVNGQLGCELIRQAKPLTIGEFEKMMAHVIQRQSPSQQTGGQQQSENLFNEVKQEKRMNENPNLLQ